MARAAPRVGPLRTALRTALLAAGVLLLSGCTTGGTQPARPAVVQGESVAEPGPPCSPSPALPGGLPAGFPVQPALPPGAVLTSLEEGAGFALANGRTTGEVEQVLAHFRTALPAAGLFVGRDEDEGRGGELTFLGGTSEGGVTVAAARCPAGSVQFTLSARTTR